VTQADSKEELAVNMENAINTALQEPEHSRYLAPLSNESYNPSQSIVEVRIADESSRSIAACLYTFQLQNS
jgi:hypothetical protein